MDKNLNHDIREFLHKINQNIGEKTNEYTWRVACDLELRLGSEDLYDNRIISFIKNNYSIESALKVLQRRDFLIESLDKDDELYIEDVYGDDWYKYKFIKTINKYDGIIKYSDQYNSNIYEKCIDSLITNNELNEILKQ